MKHTQENGFTLLEMMVVVAVMGIVLAFAIPAIKTFNTSQDLKQASAGIRDQLTMAHEKAISTGQTQTIRFMASFQSSDYHIWDGATASPSWKLPSGVTYSWDTGTQNTFRMTSDGQCLDSGMIIVTNARGDRDTVSVRLSGLVPRY